MPALRDRNPLSSDERHRKDRFRFQEDQDLFLLSHTLLRSKLSQFTGVDPRDWEFRSTFHGKPEIAAPEEYKTLQFNLSHTRGLAACAICASLPIGIDVENTAREVSCLELARRFFAAAEIAYLESKSAEALRASFYEVWTLKEAYIKACGSGLFAEPLQDFAIAPAPASVGIQFQKRKPGMALNWEFYRSRPRDACQLAMASPCPQGHAVQWQLSEELLLGQVPFCSSP